MSRQRDAALEIRNGLERHPDNPELLSALAQLSLHTNNGPDAVRLCERWVSVEGASGRPEWVRGELADEALRNNEAIRWFETAITKAPRRGVYHAALGETLTHAPTRERLRRARAELEQATALEPGVARFHFQLGQVLQQLGDLEGARRACLRALDHESSNLEALRGVIRVGRDLGRPGAAMFFSQIEQEVRDALRAETTARQVLSVRPGDARAHYAAPARCYGAGIWRRRGWT